MGEISVALCKEEKDEGGAEGPQVANSEARLEGVWRRWGCERRQRMSTSGGLGRFGKRRDERKLEREEAAMAVPVALKGFGVLTSQAALLLRRGWKVDDVISFISLSAS
ncbi:hypothetical protein O6P43_022595 [Quillaja saponaria]|uniref:Uncharacterized protein n=1 Tax=Quillaja saponaria TaxID=32244 RepID=A0AAD7PIL6_QUISA|nr:hypothetical protein O6P43_022595 [Quillaja saponaria]